MDYHNLCRNQWDVKAIVTIASREYGNHGQNAAWYHTYNIYSTPKNELKSLIGHASYNQLKDYVAFSDITPKYYNNENGPLQDVIYQFYNNL